MCHPFVPPMNTTWEEALPVLARHVQATRTCRTTKLPAPRDQTRVSAYVSGTVTTQAKGLGNAGSQDECRAHLIPGPVSPLRRGGEGRAEQARGLNASPTIPGTVSRIAAADGEILQCCRKDGRRSLGRGQDEWRPIRKTSRVGLRVVAEETHDFSSSNLFLGLAQLFCKKKAASTSEHQR